MKKLIATLGLLVWLCGSAVAGTPLYVYDGAADRAPNWWGGEWNATVMGNCVPLLQGDVNIVTQYYSPINAQIPSQFDLQAAPTLPASGWRLVFTDQASYAGIRFGSTGIYGYTYQAGVGNLAVVNVPNSLLLVNTPCSVASAILLDSIVDSGPNHYCYNGYRGVVAQPVFHGCARYIGTDPQTQEQVDFVLPEWFYGSGPIGFPFDLFGIPGICNAGVKCSCAPLTQAGETSEGAAPPRCRRK